MTPLKPVIIEKKSGLFNDKSGLLEFVPYSIEKSRSEKKSVIKDGLGQSHIVPLQIKYLNAALDDPDRPVIDLTKDGIDEIKTAYEDRALSREFEYYYSGALGAAPKVLEGKEQAAALTPELDAT